MEEARFKSLRHNIGTWFAQLFVSAGYILLMFLYARIGGAETIEGKSLLAFLFILFATPILDNLLYKWDRTRRSERYKMFMRYIVLANQVAVGCSFLLTMVLFFIHPENYSFVDFLKHGWSLFTK